MRVSQANILRIALIAATTLCAPSAFASQIPVGYVSWDVTFPGEAGQFDITNLSGPNAGPPTFPITTTVNLSNLNLVVDFVGGSSATYGPSSGYFSLSPDGEFLERQRDPHRWNKPRANLRNAYGYLQPTFNLGSRPGYNSIYLYCCDLG